MHVIAIPALDGEPLPSLRNIKAHFHLRYNDQSYRNERNGNQGQEYIRQTFAENESGETIADGSGATRHQHQRRVPVQRRDAAETLCSIAEMPAGAGARAAIRLNGI